MAKNSNINRVPNEEMGRKYRSINRPPDLIHKEEEEEGGGERSF